MQAVNSKFYRVFWVPVRVHVFAWNMKGTRYAWSPKLRTLSVKLCPPRNEHARSVIGLPGFQSGKALPFRRKCCAERTSTIDELAHRHERPPSVHRRL